MKLTLLAASPMYYQIPVYRLLAANPDIDFHVVYASTAGVRPHDAGYGSTITWDYPLLEGYSSQFLTRAAQNPLPNGTADIRDWDVVNVIRRRRGVWWLHGYNTVTHAAARATIGALRLPWVIREEQNLLSPRPWPRQMAKATMLRAFLRGAEAVYIGEQNRLWLGHYGVPEERLHWAPYTVDNDAFTRQANQLRSRRGALRAERGYAAHDIVIASVIRLIDKKQPLAMIAAFGEAARQCPELRLRIVGDGPLMDNCVALVQRSNLLDRVSFAGFTGQQGIADEYASADGFVLFSGFDETWGLVVNEAMNFGLPVVVSDRVGSSFDLVIDGETGLQVRHDDPRTLVTAMVRLARSPGDRLRIGEAGQRHVQRYSPAAAARGVAAAARAAQHRHSF